MRKIIPARTKITCDGCGEELTEDQVAAKNIFKDYRTKIDTIWEFCYSCARKTRKELIQKTTNYTVKEF